MAPGERLQPSLRNQARFVRKEDRVPGMTVYYVKDKVHDACSAGGTRLCVGAGPKGLECASVRRRAFVCVRV